MVVINVIVFKLLIVDFGLRYHAYRHEVSLTTLNIS